MRQSVSGGTPFAVKRGERKGRLDGEEERDGSPEGAGRPSGKDRSRFSGAHMSRILDMTMVLVAFALLRYLNRRDRKAVDAYLVRHTPAWR